MDIYKRLDRKLVHKGKIIDLYEDTVAIPNGNVAKWDFIGHKGAAAVVPVTADGRILMGTPVQKCTGPGNTGNPCRWQRQCG